MTGHDQFLEFAAIAIDFPLSASQRAVLDRHLETCVACRAEAAALRSDAQAIVDLPRPRLDPARADAIIGGALVRRGGRPTLRLVAVIALAGLLALGALAVGAEILRETVQPPLVVVPRPSVLPSGVPALPSELPAAWTVDFPAEAAASIGGLPVTIAESNGRLVAIGAGGCTTDPDTGEPQCVAQVRRSVDGVTWTVVRSDGFELNEIFPTSGPQIGMLDIAGGSKGFVAIGYDGADQLRVAVWTSPDGDLWEHQPSGGAFADARINAIAAGGPGWVIVGSVHRTDGPRGAIWTSEDGRIWSRVPDSPVFDVGGYLDTLEEPGSGSLRDIVADGDVLVAVGDTCDAVGRACRAATWQSHDAGATWMRAAGPDVAGNLTEVVHADAGYVGFGDFCKVLEAPCLPMFATSPDGLAWTSTQLVLLPGESRVLAAAAVDGGIVAGASRENGLIVIGTRDGTTWELLHDQFLNQSTNGTPPPGFASLVDLGGVRTPTGGAVFVGYLEVSDPDPFSPVVIHVDAGSP